jgi:hypothetical protein
MKKYIYGIYEDEEKLLNVGQLLKKQNIAIIDFFTPFPVHGLDQIQGIERTRLPFVTFIAGGIGLALAIGFQVWTSAFDWPINVGGKPMLSIPAFIPVTFELMVLFGALVSVLAFFVKSDLYPTKENIILNKFQLDNRFVVLVENSEIAKNILTESGALVEECSEY